MPWLAQVGISNALIAFPLALLAYFLGRYCRRPAVTHTLWVLVLVKLITPPLVSIPLPVVIDDDVSTSAIVEHDPFSPHSNRSPVRTRENGLF